MTQPRQSNSVVRGSDGRLVARTFVPWGYNSSTPAIVDTDGFKLTLRDVNGAPMAELDFDSDTRALTVVDLANA